MQNVYHGVPQSMVGNKLIPLNQMPSSMSEIKKLHLSKYEGREEILDRQIPLLNCLWNDVVQFLPLHPRKVFELQKELGLITEIPQYEFFEVDLDLLDPGMTVVYFKNKQGEDNVVVKWLRDVNFEQMQEVPKATINYYRTLVGTGELPFNYQFIPHILYKGVVEVSNAKIITL